ncbi:uncharacterized protein LOC114331374 [Diabrotica virgifera virgifera]|uniref:Uncharacterized protein LOC114331374 n=1 Tax=Diabrotica virgifera virgifera TaxID=50390 RepID=A0A6P7FUY9_DIAVI|nr:uncharacterized protein LOC114331374 [Diabrotica virgifera virgifera]
METNSTSKNFTKRQLRNHSPYKRRYFYPYNGRFRPEDDYAFKKHYYRQERGSKKYKWKRKSRPSSPMEGSEEYMSQKIQKTSAIIMRHLLSPDENIIPLKKDVNMPREAPINEHPKISNERKRSRSFGVVESTLSKASNIQFIENIYNQTPDTIDTSDGITQKPVTYNVDEIHCKIMNHLSNLNDRRKKTLISTRTSVYDEAIHQILKQKRLEVSRALRNVQMKTPDVTESTEWINSIMPDMGIKIEDLPHEVLEALQNTFNVSDEEDNVSNADVVEVRPTPIDDVVIKIEEEDENMETSEVISIESDSEEVVKNKVIKVEPNTEIDEISTAEIAKVQSNIENAEMPTEMISNNVPYQVFCKEQEPSHHELVLPEKSQEILVQNNARQDILQAGINLPQKVPYQVSCKEQEPSHHEQMLPEKSQEILVQNIADQGVVQDGTTLPRKMCNAATQTQVLTIDKFIKHRFKNPPKTLAGATRRMLIIDKYIAKLTEYRQNLFTTLSPKKIARKLNGRLIHKKGKSTNTARNMDTSSLQEPGKQKLTNVADTLQQTDEQFFSKETLNSYQKSAEQCLLDFGGISEKMLVLKVCEDKLVAGAESGKVFFFNLKDSKCTNVLEVTTVPITCLHYTKDANGKPYLFIGHYGSSLKVYNFYSTSLLCDIQLDDSIQCIDENWGYLFLGCLRSTIARYSMKKNNLEYEEIFDGYPVFALWATQEGARMVLLVGSRNSAVVIRDAMSGLHLRTMENIIAPTVYSMIMERNLVFCGTTSHNILVFNFHNGKLLHTYNATNSKGIRCMKIVGRCLFASCYNGKVYVFNLEDNRHIATLEGPGGIIISMEVLSNQVIMGTMSCKFSSILIPEHILRYL